MSAVLRSASCWGGVRAAAGRRAPRTARMWIAGFPNCMPVFLFSFAHSVFHLFYMWLSVWGCYASVLHHACLFAYSLPSLWWLAAMLIALSVSTAVLSPNGVFSFSVRACAHAERGGVRGCAGVFETRRRLGSRLAFAVGAVRERWSGLAHGRHMAARCEVTLLSWGMYPFSCAWWAYVCSAFNLIARRYDWKFVVLFSLAAVCLHVSWPAMLLAVCSVVCMVILWTHLLRFVCLSPVFVCVPESRLPSGVYHPSGPGPV